MLLLLKKVTVISPGSKYHLKKKDILIQDGMITKIGDGLSQKGSTVIDEKNTYVSTGWLDLFSDFCDPGYEHKETLQSGSRAALAGGYTDVCLIPNTNPSISSKSQVEYVKQKSDLVNLHPIGSVSKNIESKDLAEMYDMKLSGAIAFSDARNTISNAGLMLKALQYIKTFKGVLIEIPEESSLSNIGLMHEGPVSTQLGVQGKPSIAESIHLHQCIELLQYTDSRMHITGITTKKSVDMIRQAKKKGLSITCSVTPYHLLYTDEKLKDYDSMFKVSPPLRSEVDRKALIKGVEDGTIDCIASHHFPQDWDAKQVEFEYAKNGMISLQTMLPMLLSVSDNISIERWIDMISTKPREILGLEKAPLAEKQEACLTVFNTHQTWTYDKKSNKSLSDNSPLINQQLKGKVVAVINNKLCSIHE